jgi:3-phenylpropionate/trans-cinnamate dioxygenase ferredoxin reductase component
VRILCGRQVASSAPAGSDAEIILEDGTSLGGDLVLVGIGGVPNDELARNAGLEVEDGIVVNEFCQTSDPRILAVGDVASHVNGIFGKRWRLESWKNAEDQAAIAASFICGNPEPYNEVPWFWTDQYDWNIQVAGVPANGSRLLSRGVIGERGYLAYFLDGDLLRGAIGIGCGRDIRVAREVIKGGGKVASAELRLKGFVGSREPSELERCLS